MINELKLKLLLDFKAGRLNGLSSEGLNGEAKTFLLNRGLKVEETSIGFSQGIRGLKGVEAFKVTVVNLEKPVEELELRYSGTFRSYEKVFPYIKDSINREYTLLRTDSLFYPIPAEPSFENLVKSVVGSEFDAEIILEGVPDGLTVAFGGEIQGDLLRIEGTNRLDIAIAPFKVIEEKPFRLFLLSDKGVERTVELLRKAYDFYSSLLGKRSLVYTVIETPENYGGQAGKGYALVSGASLRSEVPANIYHELAHLWNPKATPEAHMSRFFDEAFANYLTALAVKEIHGEDEYKKFMANLEWWYKDILKKNPEAENLKVPEWGRRDLHVLSYNKGTLILKELHDLMGDSFYDLLKAIVNADVIDFETFRKLAEGLSERNLQDFFERYF
ncbi:M1 family aminopeptidase [Thermococcus sp.]|uniref:M1 family aminopeptidase n=1 Tax=Thermococcus sp. TaxID=35749 RepID=UPI0025CD3228|nr:M1 family aminopeptidase [Thermococcus sp.]